MPKFLSYPFEQGKSLAILIDPDKANEEYIAALFSEKLPISIVLVGGSILYEGKVKDTIAIIKQYTDIPVFLFPGSHAQVCPSADGILLLSMISGRNPELLIGQHVLSAYQLELSKLPILPTGYMLIDGGVSTTVQYVSNTVPIPAHKPELAATTALAGAQLGLQAIYLEAGSGATHPVPAACIRQVKAAAQLPLFVGGGINTIEKAKAALEAGADVIVIGTAAEHNIKYLHDIAYLFV